MWSKILISLFFLFIFAARIAKPDLNIDNTSVILLLLAAVPWFIQYIKSLEINGVGKLELVDGEKKAELDKKATDAGIVQGGSADDAEYTFYALRYTDPRLALAGLRIEIESVLSRIASENQLTSWDRRTSVSKLTQMLSDRGLINNDERAIIYDLIGILNRAVHSQLKDYESESFDWVFDLGLSLLHSLNQKTQK